MEFDIDVSGEDILSKDFVICIANSNNLIKGYKFDSDIIKILNSRYGQGFYRYQKSKKGKSLFKVRLYSIIVYYLFKDININDHVSLHICRDFDGKETDIKVNFKYFLETLLGIKIDEKFYFGRLDVKSNAHRYASLMRMDTKNQLKTYVNITLEEIEKFILKK